MNIVDPILFQAKINPDGIAICAPGAPLEAITYGEIARMTNNVARLAHSRGVARGQIAAISIKDNVLHAIVVLGLIRYGVVTVSAENNLLPATLAIDVLITDNASPSGNVPRVLVADSNWTLGNGAPPGGQASHRFSGTAVCRMALISGATSSIQAIAITHANDWQANARYEFLSGNVLPRASRLYCDFGLATAPAFSFLISMLCKGRTIYFPGDGPESMVQAFDLHKIDAMLATPSGLAGYLRMFELYGAVQCNLDQIICVGGTLDNALLDRLCARMCRNVLYSYSLPETGPVALAPARVVADIPGAVGFVLPDASVQVVDDTDTALAPGTEGVIRIKTAQMAAGYAGPSPGGGNAFRDGWFYPGCVGSVRPDGIVILREQ